MKKLLIVAVTTIALFSLSGCNDSTSEKEQKLTEANQSRLLNVQPPVQLSWSLEREQINRRTSLWNDPDKVSYIYLVNYGKVMAFYTIKGKVSSVNSQITNPEQITNSWSKYFIMPSPAEDGSYGENGDAIFFFTTDSTYVEWAGDYMLADKPLQMATPPALVRNID